MMRNLFNLLGTFFRLGPREFTRQYLKLPLIKFIHDTVTLYKTRTRSGVNNIKEIAIRGTIVALITSILVWLSILMYMAFYYVYVPILKHERPVHLKFTPCVATYDCQVEKGMCSFPSAHVQLTKKQQLLMLDQPYKVYLDLEMPESPANKELGMFMVCVEFRGSDGKTVANSCRSAMLHYKSNFLDTIYKVVFIPFFIFGSAEEKQVVHVELFSDYKESEYKAVTDIYVEVQTRHIEIYSAKFSVNARFSGLRYIMFNWPILSAALGITANLFFIALSCLISWYQIINSEEYLRYLGENRIEVIEDESDCSYTGEDEDMVVRPRRTRRFRDSDVDIANALDGF
ncbi:seipin isoform X2 [Anthonomus grandis grandis]|uniref:seipin isoform X2 n=1 Tax=Anthonomus grandis grandis TaxID=2921223 RepID=UPI002166BDDE|nr:seipin isoform X2 [Anthonomus grandis grandis]